VLNSELCIASSYRLDGLGIKSLSGWDQTGPRAYPHT